MRHHLPPARRKNTPMKGAMAAAARTQDETRFVTGAVNQLARYSEAVEPLKNLSAQGWKTFESFSIAGER
jgi:hypothetical protein